ncbi:MAG TPA: response regulator [Opitutaceae bacterium]|nr:response regulator [Opitutaceae bacterium]
MARILLIEDDNEIRRMMAGVLSAAGHEVSEAATGAAGLGAATAAAPDLIVIDTIMMDKEAGETIASLRREHPRLAIIATSGAARESASLTSAANVGASRMLAKPFDADALLKATHEVLGESDMTAQEESGQATGKSGHGSFTFVVLDDDADNRFLHRYTLKKTFPGCSVVECSSAEEALRKCEGPQIDAILTDHHLGGPNGSEFISAIRQKQVTCPILMVTANSDPKVERQAYEVGATRVFTPADRDFAAYLKSVLAALPPRP